MPTLGKYRWLRELLQIQSSVIPAIFPRVLFCIAFGGLISWLYAFGWPLSRPELGSLVPTLVLGLLLVFRTNTAYDRFWEGRKIWGGIINTFGSLQKNKLRQSALRNKRFCVQWQHLRSQLSFICAMSPLTVNYRRSYPLNNTSSYNPLSIHLQKLSFGSRTT